MKSLSILGATGSIGRNTLKIVAKFPDTFKIKALAAKSNVALLAKQIDRFRPELAVVIDEPTASQLESEIGASQKVKIMSGPEGYREAATLDGVDMVVYCIKKREI